MVLAGPVIWSTRRPNGYCHLGRLGMPWPWPERKHKLFLTCRVARDDVHATEIHNLGTAQLYMYMMYSNTVVINHVLRERAYALAVGVFCADGVLMRLSISVHAGHVV